MSVCDSDAGPQQSQTCCCAAAPSTVSRSAAADQAWTVGQVDTSGGPVPRVATRLSRADLWGAVRVRLNIRRMDYAVAPGLYAVGEPTPESPVLVSANYKLSFDRLREALDGLSAWILVLDTKGINVWCAAGKGTFGTDEIVRRVGTTGLSQIVKHRTLIVPQLGAPGVAAHEVLKRAGFRVVYGPVRAQDIPAFLEAGMRATPTMRRVRFNLVDRLVIVPVELALWGRYVLLLMAVLMLLAGLSRSGYDVAAALTAGARAAGLVLVSYLCGGVLAPLLLPWLPGRAFSIKGGVVGLAVAGCFALLGWLPTDGLGGKLEAASWFLLMPALSAFMAMNYTGASTFTSLSGVKREMRLAVPAQVGAAVAGLGLWLVARFV